MGSRNISLLAVVWSALFVGSNAEAQDSDQEKRPIKTFKTMYGEIIDCIDLYKQPAFDHPLLKDHKLQFAFLELGGFSNPFHGAKAFIDNYIPKCEKGQFSGAQIWVISDIKRPTNMIQVGWRVDPISYNDDRSHFFIYWKADGSGCFDLQCPGFVQVDHSVTLGGALLNSSVYEGPQFEIHVAIQEYGGVTYASKDMAFPPMGSGYFPDKSYSHACYFRQIQHMDGSRDWKVPESYRVSTHTSSEDCYGAAVNNADEFMGYTLLFGGPGGANCGV
ncbi:uncharacterized protein LOC130135159 [Syzygium oleosum]|uniref:uncharacterized protein LOC130135159 n=1 Tax=Syzygium oleosum TaxID=219896 RepID=UPI0024BA5FC9|nr:uncharacterized protein LOC130135159 [Syzygium oleosum]